jgi:hypothetical protein
MGSRPSADTHRMTVGKRSRSVCPLSCFADALGSGSVCMT